MRERSKNMKVGKGKEGDGDGMPERKRQGVK